MKNAYLKQKGFTLVEILIVVVILAILAALILPRLLSQPERAVIAEAQQMLGTLRRAQQTRMDITSSTAYLNVNCTAATCSDANLGVLGIANITGGKYIYTCSGTSCMANRTGADAGTYVNATVTLADSGNFSCDGTLYKLASSTDPTKGCAI